MMKKVMIGVLVILMDIGVCCGAQATDPNKKLTPPSEELFKAVRDNKFEDVQAALKNDGLDINAFAKEGYGLDGHTLLHVAILSNNFKIAELLIKSGADVNVKNKKGQSALGTGLSIDGVSDEMIRLLEKNFDFTKDPTLLLGAVNKKDASVVSLFLDKEQTNDAVDKALRGAKLWFEVQQKNEAINESQKSISKALIVYAHKKKIDYAGLLKSIVTSKHFKKEEKVAFINSFEAEEIDFNIKDANGISPLLHAINCDQDKDIITALIAKGADKDLVNNSGHTPLYLAAEKGKKEIVAQLLAAGANVNFQPTDTRNTALHIAVQGGHTDIIKALLEKGANPRACP